MLDTILKTRLRDISYKLTSTELRSVHINHTPLITSMSCCRNIALKTEGYQAGDMVALVNRAMSLAEQDSIRLKASHHHSPSHYVIAALKATKKDSVATVVPTLTVPQADPCGTSLTSDHLQQAIEGFVPASLRGLSLQTVSEVDFSSVGGLESAKTTLRETLQWPSKVRKCTPHSTFT